MNLKRRTYRTTPKVFFSKFYPILLMHQFTYKAKETEVHAITHTKATKKKEKEKTVKRELRKAKVLSSGYL